MLWIIPLVIAIYGARKAYVVYTEAHDYPRLPESDNAPTIYATNSYDDSFQSVGAKLGIDWKLLKAIGMVESSLKADNKNLSDPSFGLMQVLCTGVTDPKTGKFDANARCKNEFPAVPEWDGTITPQKLFDPYRNVLVAGRILKWNIDKYGERKGVAVYNNWGARDETEPFTNQDYVDKVYKNYRGL